MRAEQRCLRSHLTRPHEPGVVVCLAKISLLEGQLHEVLITSNSFLAANFLQFDSLKRLLAQVECYPTLNPLIPTN
jgi:hypothetical protein